jgi:hypothetical protein
MHPSFLPFFFYVIRKDAVGPESLERAAMTFLDEVNRLGRTSTAAKALRAACTPVWEASVPRSLPVPRLQNRRISAKIRFTRRKSAGYVLLKQGAAMRIGRERDFFL